MRPSTIVRLVEGAAVGSLVLTLSEAVELDHELTPRACVVIAATGTVVEIRSIPWHVLPDDVDDLPTLDPWPAQLHESLVDGLITPDDVRNLLERPPFYDQDSPDA